MLYHKTPEGYKIREAIPSSIKEVKIEEISQDSQAMKRLSLDMKELLNLNCIHLPVHDIPVLHALGVKSKITWEEGIMLKEEPYDDMENLEEIHFDTKRLETLFKVIRELKEEGETIFIEIPGLYTALSALVPFEKVIQSTKYPIYEKITEKALSDLKRYVKELDGLKVDTIYYSDELSRLDIVGTHFYKRYYSKIAKEILELSEILNYAQLSVGKYTFEAMKTLQILKKKPDGKIHTRDGLYDLKEKEWRK